MIRNLPSWFSSDQVDVLNVNLTYEQLITVGCAVGVAVGLWVLFKRTRIGVSMRAVVDDPALASMTGARSSRISGFAWMIGFMLAGLAGILLAPGTGMSIQILSELVIFGYAAAIVGRLRSLPLTFLGAMILGVGESMAVGYVPSSALNDVTAVLPMGLLIIALLILPQAKLAVGRVVRLRPPGCRPSPPPWSAAWCWWRSPVLLSSLITGNNLYTLGLGLSIGLAALSLVLLSGYGGQAWLCQFTFIGLGSWAMTKVDGGSSILGVLAAIGLCAAAGGILALPALRLRGLYMALTTLAFAALMDSIFFIEPLGDQGRVPHRRTPRHLRHAVHLGPVLRRAHRHRVRPVPDRRGGIAAGPVRASAGGHERQPGRLRHRGDEHHQDQAGRVHPGWGNGRAGRRTLRGHVQDGVGVPVRLRQLHGPVRGRGPGRGHHPERSRSRPASAWPSPR